MPLPTVDDIVTYPNPSPLSDALKNYPPGIGGVNTQHVVRIGNLKWTGNKMSVSNDGPKNYRFIVPHPGKARFCVVPCVGGGEAYVISDQYGGCEYHELYNANYDLLAFLHVYRGQGKTTDYTLANGWVLRSVKRSAVLAKRYYLGGNNWSVSVIDKANSTVQTKFIHVDGHPTLTVRDEDDGDTPY
jgi:hypothetical protein